MKLSIFDRFSSNGSDDFDSFDEELEDAPTRKGFRELVSEGSRPAPLEEDTPQA